MTRITIACILATLAAGCVGPAKTLVRTQAQHTVQYHARPVAREEASEVLQDFKDEELKALKEELAALKQRLAIVQAEMESTEKKVNGIGILLLGVIGGGGVTAGGMKLFRNGKAAT
jgi:acetylornithine/succinyldiaminopimelate/putrescine aminotransferase